MYHEIYVIKRLKKSFDVKNDKKGHWNNNKQFSGNKDQKISFKR